MSDPAFTFTATGVRVEFYAEEVEGGVKFTYKTFWEPGYEDYRIDLNGFFLDIGGDGGSVRSVGSKANNMNGGNNDGFDYAVALGSVGGNDADDTEGCFVISGITLADLEGADAGLRATSYGPDGEGSLKLVADYTPPDGNPPGDNFPEWPQDISNVVFYFEDNGDITQDTNGDGHILIKIDNVPASASDDLDDWYEDVLVYLKDNNYIDDDDVFLGAAIKGGNEDTKFYAMDGDTDPELFPDNIGDTSEPPDGVADGPGGNVHPALLDYTVNYGEIFV